MILEKQPINQLARLSRMSQDFQPTLLWQLSNPIFSRWTTNHTKRVQTNSLCYPKLYNVKWRISY